jgi:hypothetical protein
MRGKITDVIGHTLRVCACWSGVTVFNQSDLRTSLAAIPTSLAVATADPVRYTADGPGVAPRCDSGKAVPASFPQWC